MFHPAIKRSRMTAAFLAVAVIGGALTIRAIAQQQTDHLGYQDTPMLPGGKWHVHDGTRPQPTIIDPGTASTADMPGRPPSDAIVLFDGKDLSKWSKDNGQAPEWEVRDGYMESVPNKGSIMTKDPIGDCQLHVEFAEPTPPHGTSQERGNSGVMLVGGRYEIQVLDCYDNKTYPDGQTAAIYGQYPPLVNACRKPGEWQTYDILWQSPRFQDGKLVTPAYATVFHNGVVVHNHTQLIGITGHRILAKYEPHDPAGPLVLQEHHNHIRYRNIWYRPLKDYDQP